MRICELVLVFVSICVDKEIGPPLWCQTNKVWFVDVGVVDVCVVGSIIRKVLPLAELGSHSISDTALVDIPAGAVTVWFEA